MLHEGIFTTLTRILMDASLNINIPNPVLLMERGPVVASIVTTLPQQKR